MAEVIVALDFPSGEEAFTIVDSLGETGRSYKVGLELFTREGPALIRELERRGKTVMLDLKLHDIPSTVAATVHAASQLGVDLLTIHSLGGRTMLEAASTAARLAYEASDRQARLLVLAVTMLTSQSAAEVEGAWGKSIKSLRGEVERLGALAAECDVDGVVASVLETSVLKRKLGSAFLVATPGIRQSGGARDDQTRVATPRAALEAGADFLVVGRPITRAPNPVTALEAILSELSAEPGRVS